MNNTLFVHCSCGWIYNLDIIFQLDVVVIQVLSTDRELYPEMYFLSPLFRMSLLGTVFMQHN